MYKQKVNQSGFTLLEVMVVIVILGVLAALVVPSIMERPGEARQTKAAVDIKTISQTLELYRLDNYRYPSSQQSIAALVEKPTEAPVPARWKKYLPKVPKDPWGNPYIYLQPGLHADFDIISYGADGVAGGEGEDRDIESWNLDDS